jgi:hypothetical protein
MTIELSKTQINALRSGAAHDEGHITLPPTLRGGARQKVLTSLIGAKLAGYRTGTLVVTPTGMAAIGASTATDIPVKAVKKTKPVEADKPARTARANTKQAKLIEMLRRAEGATLDEIVKALDWQAHTVRGAIAGALKKKLGLKIESEKVDAERGRVYRIGE